MFESELNLPWLQNIAHKLAQTHSIFIGTSSWKYEGWKGLLYQNYYPTKADFNKGCLREYSQIFPVIGADFTFYALPSETLLRPHLERVASGSRFVLKATEIFTAKHSVRTNKTSDSFLDAGSFFHHFWTPAQKILGDALGTIILEFGKFRARDYVRGRDFMEDLNRFLTEAIKKGVRPEFLCVEIRNESWLVAPFLQMLKSHGVGFVANLWTEMPAMPSQFELVQQTGVRLTAVRALLSRGATYEQTGLEYEPFNRIHKIEPDAREGISSLIQARVDRAAWAGDEKPLYILLNNNLEGCAPLSWQQILQSVEKRVML